MSHFNLLKKLALVATLALPLLLTGCRDPEEVILWSPDGQTGLVDDDQRGTVIDATGAILGELGTAADPKAQWEAKAWLADSRRALVVNSAEPKNWDEAAALLGHERAQTVERAALALLGLVREYHGDWKEFGKDDPRLDEWISGLNFAPNYISYSKGKLTNTFRPALPLFWLRERNPAEIAPLQQAFEGESLETAKVYELAVREVRKSGEAAGEVLLSRSIDPIVWAAPSPDGKVIAFVRNGPEAPMLCVVPVGGSGEPIIVDWGVAQAAWTLDGHSLVYQKTSAPFIQVEKQAQLGTLASRAVRDGSGALLAELPPPEDLAGVLFSPIHHRVACLPDGRILFASAEVSLPAVDATPRDTLFALRLGETRVIERVVREADRGEVPDRLDRFVVSPDGRNVALPGADGEVALLSLETGAVTSIQGKVTKYQEDAKNEGLAHPPAASWRGPNELCYLIAPGDPEGSPRRAEVVLQTLGGKRRVISKTWSDEMTRSFLPRPKAQ